ncbi:MAG: exodeoxyribonuclease V subunit alpha [Nocardioides sp.]
MTVPPRGPAGLPAGASVALGVDEWHADLVRSRTGLSAILNEAGLLGAADLHVAGRLAELAGSGGDGKASADGGADFGGDPAELVLVGLALAVRAVRMGSVGVDLARAHDEIAEVLSGSDSPALPDPARWQEVLAASRLADAGIVHGEYGLIYLDRYHRLETQVCADLTARRSSAPVVDESVLAAALRRIFPGEGYAEQRVAAERASRLWTTVLTGGPGTGKTTTVAGLLGVLAELAQPDSKAQSDSTAQPAQSSEPARKLSIALTAPTGKATARLKESVAAELARLSAEGRLSAEHRDLLTAAMGLTLHRLLGWQPGSATRFAHHRDNRLPYDVVVVDETSMVELMMMARLLEALRPDTRLILVGDPGQLSSVGAGAVLSDLVDGLGTESEVAPSSGAESTGYESPVVSLRTTHRFGAEIGALAEALREGDEDRALGTLRAGGDTVEFLELDQPAGSGGSERADRAEGVEQAADALRPILVEAALAVRTAALDGDASAAMAALHRHRLICAHRDGPYGVGHWNRLVESWLAAASGVDYWPAWYAGRPLLVTRNDYPLGIYNGEIGVTVRTSEGRLRGLISGSDAVLDFATTRLADIETMHAMTVHKSQGSQAAEVTVLMPREDSRLLTRQLLYTAVTRAERRVRIVGTEAEIRAAVRRQSVRASGLRHRLRRPVP